VLYDALIRLGYNGDVPIYRCCLSKARGLDVCEVSVTISFDPMVAWMGTIIGSEPDTTILQTAHVALTSLYESRLAATASMPITLFPICNRENRVWKQRLEAMFDLEGPHFSTGMAVMARYA
jgi:hypothetical protein